MFEIPKNFDEAADGGLRLTPCSGWAKRRPKRAGEYLIAVENVSKNNPNKSVVHAIIHGNGALTGPVLYDGSQVNIRVLDHIKIRGWMAMPSFPNAGAVAPPPQRPTSGKDVPGG